MSKRERHIAQSEDTEDNEKTVEVDTNELFGHFLLCSKTI